MSFKLISARINSWGVHEMWLGGGIMILLLFFFISIGTFNLLNKFACAEQEGGGVGGRDFYLYFKICNSQRQ